MLEKSFKESAAGRLTAFKQDQPLQPRKAEKTECSRYSGDIRFSTADAMHYCDNNHSSLQDIFTPYPPSLRNETSLRKLHDRMQFASHSNLQRLENELYRWDELFLAMAKSDITRALGSVYAG